MDFRLTPEEEAFRQEVREWLQAELPPDWERLERLIDFEEPEWVGFAQAFRQKLADKGWLVMHWPKEWGGQADPVKNIILTEELSYWGAPTGGQPVNQLAAILMAHGSEAQKQYFLSGLAQARWKWVEGYSEPGGGSDLANIQTRGVEDGDDFVISGAKIWNAAHSDGDWMFGLIRTDMDKPKHRGISFMLIDMRSPGISWSRVPMMWGKARGLVNLEQVRVPRTNVVGERGRGFYVAMASLDSQRASLDRLANTRRIVDLLVQYARETAYEGQRVIDRPGIRNQLADVMSAVECLRLMSYKVAWLQAQELPCTREASIVKIFGPDTIQRAYRVGMQMIGAYGLLEPGSRWAPLFGKIENGYLENFARTIGSGTSEINRSVVATRGLGLPRG